MGTGKMIFPVPVGSEEGAKYLFELPCIVKGCQMLRTIPECMIRQNSRKYKSQRQHHNNHDRRSKP